MVIHGQRCTIVDVFWFTVLFIPYCHGSLLVLPLFASFSSVFHHLPLSSFSSGFLCLPFISFFSIFTVIRFFIFLSIFLSSFFFFFLQYSSFPVPFFLSLCSFLSCFPPSLYYHFIPLLPPSTLLHFLLTSTFQHLLFRETHLIGLRHHKHWSCIDANTSPGEAIVSTPFSVGFGNRKVLVSSWVTVYSALVPFFRIISVVGVTKI